MACVCCSSGHLPDTFSGDSTCWSQSSTLLSNIGALDASLLAFQYFPRFLGASFPPGSHSSSLICGRFRLVDWCNTVIINYGFSVMLCGILDILLRLAERENT